MALRSMTIVAAVMMMMAVKMVVIVVVVMPLSCSALIQVNVWTNRRV